MSVHEIEGRYQYRKITRIPRVDVQCKEDEDRSVDINMMRKLMRTYPDKAVEEAAHLRFVLTKERA
jgi:hypothetical protein